MKAIDLDVEDGLKVRYWRKAGVRVHKRRMKHQMLKHGRNRTMGLALATSQHTLIGAA